MPTIKMINSESRGDPPIANLGLIAVAAGVIYRIQVSTILAQNLSGHNGSVVRNLKKNSRIEGRKKVRDNSIDTEELPNILGRLPGGKS